MKTIDQEIEEASKKYGCFNSTHEVYGVIAEELAEFFDLVRQKPNKGIPKRNECIHELTQIAAICQRAISELKNDQIKWV